MKYKLEYKIAPIDYDSSLDYKLTQLLKRKFETKEDAIGAAYEINPFLNYSLTEIIDFDTLWKE